MGRMPIGKYILMHSVIYRTELLRECKLELPKHTFYVDNIFVYKPLPYVKTMYYMDVNFYRYFIGRNDQSVNEEVMIRRIDQQLLVNRLMIDIISEEKLLIKYTKIYAEIFGYYYGSVIYYANSFWYRGKSGKEKRTLEIFKKCRYSYLQKALYECFRKGSKPSGKKRQTSFCCIV